MVLFATTLGARGTDSDGSSRLAGLRGIARFRAAAKLIISQNRIVSAMEIRQAAEYVSDLVQQLAAETFGEGEQAPPEEGGGGSGSSATGSATGSASVSPLATVPEDREAVEDADAAAALGEQEQQQIDVEEAALAPSSEGEHGVGASAGSSKVPERSQSADVQTIPGDHSDPGTPPPVKNKGVIRTMSRDLFRKMAVKAVIKQRAFSLSGGVATDRLKQAIQLHKGFETPTLSGEEGPAAPVGWVQPRKAAPEDLSGDEDHGETAAGGEQPAATESEAGSPTGTAGPQHRKSTGAADDLFGDLLDDEENGQVAPVVAAKKRHTQFDDDVEFVELSRPGTAGGTAGTSSQDEPKDIQDDLISAGMNEGFSDEDVDAPVRRAGMRNTQESLHGSEMKKAMAEAKKAAAAEMSAPLGAGASSLGSMSSPDPVSSTSQINMDSSSISPFSPSAASSPSSPPGRAGLQTRGGKKPENAKREPGRGPPGTAPPGGTPIDHFPGAASEEELNKETRFRSVEKSEMLYTPAPSSGDEKSPRAKKGKSPPSGREDRTRSPTTRDPSPADTERGRSLSLCCNKVKVC